MPRTTPALSLEHVKIACETCSLSELCLPRGLSAGEVETLAHSVHKPAPIDRGQHLYRAGDTATGLYAVRAGSFKTYMTTADGEEQVLGFHMPGELIGLDGLETRKHGCGAVALETTTVCGLPFDELETLCRTLPNLHHELHRVIGREISKDHMALLLLGKRKAEERLTSFLLSLSTRFKERGYSATEFNLTMSRQDIGNYLGLAIETVSRIFHQLQEDGLLKVNRRNIVICDLDRLKAMVSGCIGRKSGA